MVDSITPAGMPGLGIIEAKTSNYGGHPPEFWAERLTEKIVSSSDSEDPYIKEQARAYRDMIYKVCLIYIKKVHFQLVTIKKFLKKLKKMTLSVSALLLMRFL